MEFSTQIWYKEKMLNISRCLSIANVTTIIFYAICEFSIKKDRRREIQYFEYDAN